MNRSVFRSKDLHLTNVNIEANKIDFNSSQFKDSNSNFCKLRENLDYSFNEFYTVPTMLVVILNLSSKIGKKTAQNYQIERKTGAT